MITKFPAAGLVQKTENAALGNGLIWRHHDHKLQNEAELVATVQSSAQHIQTYSSYLELTFNFVVHFQLSLACNFVAHLLLRSMQQVSDACRLPDLTGVVCSMKLLLSAWPLPVFSSPICSMKPLPNDLRHPAFDGSVCSTTPFH